MCTLTWLTHENGYELFFNRDEQRTRPRAESPCFDRKTKSIMPIDPQGKGTWIAVNNAGITLCLLNNYQQEVKNSNKNYLSRGLLIPRLIKHQQYENLLNELMHLDLSHYTPFWLCIFPANLTSHNEAPYSYQWDGEVLTKEQAHQPFISSAVMLPEVKKERIRCFEKMMKHDSKIEDHLAYHSSHEPKKGKLSVCMHRNDACTQSLSHISVSDEIVFRYQNGSPCKSVQWESVAINHEV